MCPVYLKIICKYFPLPVDLLLMAKPKSYCFLSFLFPREYFQRVILKLGASSLIRMVLSHTHVSSSESSIKESGKN